MPTADESNSPNRLIEYFHRLRSDLAVAAHSISRAPTFAVATIAILGLSIGVSTAMFTIYRTVLVDRLPVIAQEQLVVMHPLDKGGAHLDVAYPYLAEIARDSSVFRAAAGVYHLGANPTPFVEGNNTIELLTAVASPNFFNVFGMRPVIGRLFRREDGDSGASPVIMLSYETWRRRFNGDSSVIERSLTPTYSQKPARIIGVTPPGFEYPAGAEAWIPLLTGFTAQVDIIARLAPRATLDGARAELLALVRRSDPFAGMIRKPNETRYEFSGVEAHSFADTVLGNSRPVLIALMLAVALLLVIACVNVGNLVLVRLLGRNREIAVRRALGASYGDVARLFFVENAMLGVTGGVAGLAVAVTLLRLVHAAAPRDLPRSDALGLAGAPVLEVAIVTVIVTLLFGLMPSVMASQGNSYSALRSDSRSGMEGKARRRTRRWLVSVQMALSVVLLTGAALLVRTLSRLETMDLGYAPGHLSMLSYTGPKSVLSTPEKIADEGRQLINRIEAIPGVVAASSIESAPFKGQSFYIMKVAPAEVSASDREHYPLVPFEFVGTDYFRTFRIAIKQGRGFAATDTKGSPKVVVISQTLAHQLWPNESAIGKQLNMVNDRSDWTVVGIASDTHYRELRNGGPVAYFDIEQLDPFWNGIITVRTTGTLAATLPAIRAVTHEVDPSLILFRAETMEQMLDQPLARPRLSALLMSAFSVVALLLSAIGLYGVMSSAVRQQTRDIGVRVALGATSSHVRRLVLGEAIRVVSLGALIGLGGALAGGRLLASQLYGVDAIDPPSLAAALTSLLAIGVVAAYLPARRAARIDPVEALRSE